MTAQQPDLFAGESLKANGIQRVLSRNPSWSDLAINAIHNLAMDNESFTADDLRFLSVELGPPPHPNAIGAAFSAAAKAGWIRRESFRKSTTISNHARYITVWKSNLV